MYVTALRCWGKGYLLPNTHKAAAKYRWYKPKIHTESILSVPSAHFVPPILPPQQQQLAKRKGRKRRCHSLSQSTESCGLLPCCWFVSPLETGAGRCGRLRKYSSRPTIVLDHGRSDSNVWWQYEILWIITVHWACFSIAKDCCRFTILCVYAHM